MPIINFDVLLKDLLRDVPAEYIHCRDLHHTFTVKTDFHQTEVDASKDILLERRMVCVRCGTTRTDRYLLIVENSGVTRMKRVGSWYSYPENYIIPEMSRSQHAKEILRAERYRRLVKQP